MTANLRPLRWLLIFLATLVLPLQAKGIQIEFSSVVRSQLRITGANDQFEFIDGDNGRDFRVTFVSSGSGSAVNLQGNIGGHSRIGAITNSSFSQLAPVIEEQVSLFSIDDGSSHSLSGRIDWDSIRTSGAIAALNPFGTLNLSNLTYSGSNLDLAELAAFGSAQISLGFTALPKKTLTQLTADSSVFKSSYSGYVRAGGTNISVPDGASTLLLFGFALMTMAAVRRLIARKVTSDE